MRLLLPAMTFSLVVALANQVAAQAPSGAKTLAPISVRGSVPIWNVQAPVLVAKAKGFFDEVGLRQVDFKVGGLDVETLRGLAAGGFDIQINATTGTALRAIAQGAPIKIIAGFAQQARYSIFVKQGMTAADLKGKTIAVAEVEDFTSEMLKAALRQLGLDPKDVVMVPAGSPPDRMAAHFAGKVNASFNIYNLLPVYASRGYAPLINLYEVKELEPWSLVTVAANKSFLAKSPEAATAFLTAAIRARAWYHDPKNAAELRAILTAAGIEFRSDAAWTFEYDLDRQMTPTDFDLPRVYFDNTAAFLLKSGSIPRAVSFDEATDLSFLARAQKAAGVK
ncbi:MAG TPA: ABC transporter substrate-binding protein [Candidatus Methylomirabilis sp.]|nr:ABC transporter substrate-binding protein [Candidatus Methylomirabilis sp.]